MKIVWYTAVRHMELAVVVIIVTIKFTGIKINLYEKTD